jgi:XdhC Rossmann domain
VRPAEARLLRSVVDVESCHAAVVMSHHLNSDAEYLQELAEVPNPAYMGLLGPMARRKRLAKELGPAADKLESRIRGPVRHQRCGNFEAQSRALSIRCPRLMSMSPRPMQVSQLAFAGWASNPLDSIKEFPLSTLFSSFPGLPWRDPEIPPRLIGCHWILVDASGHAMP